MPAPLCHYLAMYEHKTFGKILKLLDRNTIRKAIKEHNSDKYSKGFGTWNHLVVMMFSQYIDRNKKFISVSLT